MEKLKIGKIVGTHGLKGELKIRSNSDFADKRFKKGNEIIISYQNQDINLVEKYIGSFVYGYKDDELLDADEYFYTDLIGMQVVSTEGTKIGPVTSIYDNTRHDILNIDHNGKNVAIPYVDAFIKDVDVEKKIIVVMLIKGLIDED